MLYILFRPAAGVRLMSLPGWNRERIADAIMLLAESPRPRNARKIPGGGYSFDIWVGQTRVLYRIIRNDRDKEDIGIIILRIA